MEAGEPVDAPIPLVTTEGGEPAASFLDASLQRPDLPGHQDPLQGGCVGVLQLGQGCLLGEVTDPAGAEDGPRSRGH